MDTKLIESPREFTIIKNGTPLPFPVRKLTIKQLAKRADAIRDIIRNDRRSEYMKIAESLPAADRSRFLIEAGRSNVTVDNEAFRALDESAIGIRETLVLATDLSSVEIESLMNMDGGVNLEELDYARYHALGMNVDELRKLVAEQTEDVADSGDTFPEAQNGG